MSIGVAGGHVVGVVVKVVTVLVVLVFCSMMLSRELYGTCA